MIHTSSNKVNQWRIDDDGFLRVTARVIKEGVFPYKTRELPTEMLVTMAGRFGDNSDIVKEYIPLPEFTEDALKSLEGKPVIVNMHDWRTAENNLIDGLTVGNVAGTPKVVDNKYIECDLLITDPETIQRIKEKTLIEVSAGYTSSMVTEQGAFDGDMYDAVQKEIKFNHVLLLPEGKGRCGYDVKIYNSKKEIPMKVKILNAAGIEEELEVSDEATAKRVEKLFADIRQKNADELQKKDEEVETKNQEIAKKDEELKTANQEVETHKTKLSDVVAALQKATAELEKFASEEYQETQAKVRQEYQANEEAVIEKEIAPEKKEEIKKELSNCSTAAKEKKMNARMRFLVTKIMNGKGVDLTNAFDETIEATFKTLAVNAKVENQLPKKGNKADNDKGFVHPIYQREAKA